MQRRTLLFFLTIILTACSSSPISGQPITSATPPAEPIAMKRVANSAMQKSSVSAEKKMNADALISWNEAEVIKSLPKTENEWKKILNPDQYEILRQAGTETPFTSDLLNEHRKGTFVTADCGEPAFRSETKFDSGTGWPSFWAPISKDAVIEKVDNTYGLGRTEILSKCGGHLGHVFNDGPAPTGLRYCMNGVALKFIPDKEQ